MRHLEPKGVLALIATVALSLSVSAQTPHRVCASDQVQQAYWQANPQAKQQYDQLEAQVQDWIKHHPNGSGRTVLTIPVVFHIVHNGESIGTGTNISNTQIMAQLDQLNDDFRALNADIGNVPSAFQAAVGDAEIEFCLAVRDPNGNTTTGIIRWNRNTMGWTPPPYTTTYIENTIKPATIWDRDDYLNIWSINMAGGILGYAYLPMGPANADGVVCLYSTFGSLTNPFPGAAPYNLGRTATHEVGHWFNLQHIWYSNGCGTDDFVSDTPLQDDEHFGCPSFPQVSCSNGPNGDMFMNYMDYVDDDCMIMFTDGQGVRMQAAINGPRSSLLSSQGCVPVTTTPEISFVTTSTSVTENSADGTSGCRGYDDITITMQISMAPTGAATVTLSGTGSAYNPADYIIVTNPVVFPSGTTANQNVTVRIYNDKAVETAETVTLSFTVSGSTNAVPASTNITHAITISDNDVAPTPVTYPTLLTENFESGTFPPVGWTKSQAAGADGWESGTAASLSSAGFMIPNTNNTSIAASNDNSCGLCNSSVDYLITPSLNFSGLTSATLTFDAYFENSSGSAAYVKVSGTSATGPWTDVYTMSSNPSSWQNGITVNLNAYAGDNSVWINFHHAGGNVITTTDGFAIDNLVVTGSTTGIAVATALGATDNQYFGPMSTVYYIDAATNKLLVALQNTTTHDYGCTSVTIDRAGSGATAFWSSDPSDYLADKTWLVTTTTNNPSGAFNISEYYTVAEINGWQSVTGKPWSMFQAVKSGGAISNVTPANPNANGNTNYISSGAQSNYGLDYKLTANFTTGFSGFGGGDPGNNPLPIEVTNDLKAHYEPQSGCILTWSVAAETNASHYVIERSADGSEFSELGRLQAGIVGSRNADYTYVDQEPLDGDNYYRFRVMDHNGASTKSNIAHIWMPFDAASRMTVTPNPSSGMVTLMTRSPGTVYVYDGLGRLVHRQQALADVPSAIDLSTLQPGTYWFVLLSTGSPGYALPVVLR